MTLEEAAGIALCFDTAALGLYGPRGVKGGAALLPFWDPKGQIEYRNRPILIFGGATNVGFYGTLDAIKQQARKAC